METVQADKLIINSNNLNNQNNNIPNNVIAKEQIIVSYFYGVASLYCILQYQLYFYGVHSI